MVGESISLVSTLLASVEAIQNDDIELAQQPTIGAEPTTKRVFRCSGCGDIGHKINQYNTRQLNQISSVVVEKQCFQKVVVGVVTGMLV